MSAVLAWDTQRHVLDGGDMDLAHQEFITLVNQTAGASQGEFAAHFLQLLEHTRQHFAHEEQLMEASNFPAIGEHKGEHRRILGELQQLATRAEKGTTSMARAYVHERLPEWFNLHTATMDSALAASLKPA